MSLQIRPDISKFSFNPPQVIGQMKLNRIKRKPKTIHKPCFPTPESLSLNRGPQNHHPWLVHVEVSRREKKRDIWCDILLKYRRYHWFAKKRVRVRCPKQKHAHQSLVCFSTWLSHHVHSGFLRASSYMKMACWELCFYWGQMQANQTLHSFKTGCDLASIYPKCQMTIQDFK